MSIARRRTVRARSQRWVLSHPDVAAPVVGPSRQAPHLAHVSKSMAMELTPVEREQLSSVFAAIAE